MGFDPVQGLDKVAQLQMNHELSGKKLVVEDIFCEPSSPGLLGNIIRDGLSLTSLSHYIGLLSADGHSNHASNWYSSILPSVLVCAITCSLL